VRAGALVVVPVRLLTTVVRVGVLVVVAVGILEQA
jgi:hypothetical protein